jgi:HPt (histidine-containing phosphotransfer) domain-containing protein
MTTQQSWPSLDVPEGGDDPYADLRAAYLMRLRTELAQLTVLRAKLAADGMVAGEPYRSIHRIAHGMAGAAAIFTAADILSAALALEQALGRAVPGADDAAVRRALDTMIDSLRAM